MKIAGIEVGAFTVLVGQDDDEFTVALHGLGRRDHAARGIHESSVRAWARMDGVPVVLIDLGDSLHPAAIPAAMAALRAAGVPVVATTHNVYVLDCCDPDEVLVLHDGHAVRLSEFPDARLREMLSTGALWIAEGEAWVTAVAEARGT